MREKFNKWYRLGVGLMALLAVGIALPVSPALAQGMVVLNYQGDGTWGNCVAIDPLTGDIVATGSTVVGTNTDFVAASIQSDGSLNTAFGGGIVATPYYPAKWKGFNAASNAVSNACAVQSDGKVVSAGFAAAGETFNFALVRYNTDGTLDTSFGNGGIAVTNFSTRKTSIGSEILAIVLQPDGRILVTGVYNWPSNYEQVVTARYTTTGALDTTFASRGYVVASLPYQYTDGFGIGLQSSGDVVVAAGINGGGAALLRYTANGALDTSFGKNRNGMVTSPIDGYAMVIDGAGNITLAGMDGAYDCLAIARFTSSGALDNTFGSGGYDYYVALGSGSRAHSVALGSFQQKQPDGTMVMVPAIVTTGYPWVAWFDTSGNLLYSDDTYVNVGTGGRSLVVQPDDKVVAVSTDYSTPVRSMIIVRYNADGTIDTTF